MVPRVNDLHLCGVRRTCPGLYLGETCLTLATLHVLAAFDVSPAHTSGDSAMIEGTSEIEYTTGLVRYVLFTSCFHGAAADLSLHTAIRRVWRSPCVRGPRLWLRLRERSRHG